MLFELAAATADNVATSAPRALTSAGATALWPKLGFDAESSALSIEKEVMQEREHCRPLRASGWNGAGSILKRGTPVLPGTRHIQVHMGVVSRDRYHD